MMAEEERNVHVARQRVQQLRERVTEIVTDPHKPRRVKDMELAGVRGMIEQIQKEIRSSQALRIRRQIQALRSELNAGAPDSLTSVMAGTLDLVEQMAMEEA